MCVHGTQFGSIGVYGTWIIISYPNHQLYGLTERSYELIYIAETCG